MTFRVLVQQLMIQVRLILKRKILLFHLVLVQTWKTQNLTFQDQARTRSNQRWLRVKVKHLDQKQRSQTKRLVKLDLALKVTILISQLITTLDFPWELNFQTSVLINRHINQLQLHIMSRNNQALKLWYLVLDQEAISLM